MGFGSSPVTTWAVAAAVTLPTIHSDKEIVRQQHFPGLHGPLSKLFGRLVATELPIVIEH
jgi:hypothetical protein